MTLPSATYRVQFRNGMTFDRACGLLPYLKSLGISHLYASPIFTATKDLKLKDDELGNVFVPLSFWKVVIAPSSSGTVRAFGFITSQKQNLDDDPPFEEFTPAGFTNEQASLDKIESQTIISFDDALKQVDVMNSHPDEHEILPLDSLDQVWLGRR